MLLFNKVVLGRELEGFYKGNLQIGCLYAYGLHVDYV